MKKTRWLAAFSVLLAGRAALWAAVPPRVIYGNDDRLDLYQVKDEAILNLADATLALFREDKVIVDPVQNKAWLSTVPYGKSRGLCKEEPFYNQETGASCSGSLVAPDIVMTAGHCVTSDSACRDIKFVFGFAVKNEGEWPKVLPASEVYRCAKLIGRSLPEYLGADWALVRLDRPVAGHKPLALNKTGVIAKDAPLFVIGHPAGLPAKVAGGASVRDASPDGYFTANLDTYAGNSGSAVFNAQTGLIEGILVRGEEDYVLTNDGCRVSNKCPNGGCRGEDVTKISAVIPGIPGIALAGGETFQCEPIGDPLSAMTEKLAVQALDFDSR